MQFRIYDSMPNGETAKVLLNVSQERNNARNLKEP